MFKSFHIKRGGKFAKNSMAIACINKYHNIIMTELYTTASNNFDFFFKIKNSPLEF